MSTPSTTEQSIADVNSIDAETPVTPVDGNSLEEELDRIARDVES